MAKENTFKVMVNGKIVPMSAKAFEMAKQYFGAVKVDEIAITKPIELTKPILIPKIKVEKPIELQKTKLAELLDTPPPKLPDIIVKDVPAEVEQAKKVARKPRKK